MDSLQSDSCSLLFSERSGYDLQEIKMEFLLDIESFIGSTRGNWLVVGERRERTSFNGSASDV